MRKTIKRKQWDMSFLMVERILDLMEYDGFHKDAIEAVKVTLERQQSKDYQDKRRLD